MELLLSYVLRDDAGRWLRLSAWHTPGIRQLTMVVKCLQCNEEICNRVLPGCTDDAGAKAGDAGTADAMRYLKDPHVCKRGAL